MFGRIVMLLLLSVSLSAWAQDATEAEGTAAPSGAAEASDAPNAAPGDGAPGANDANHSQAATSGKNDPVIDENATDSATCAAKWARFHKSQECFAPYHNVNGTMKPGAFEHCKNYKSPDECSPEDDLMHLPVQQVD